MLIIDLPLSHGDGDKRARVLSGAIPIPNQGSKKKFGMKTGHFFSLLPALM
jgi:hypothetical protein